VRKNGGNDSAQARRGLRGGRRCRIVAAFAKHNRSYTMSLQNPAERDLAELLVESLNLEDVDAAGIDPEAPLFGDGLGLDSIDALELALAVSKKYGFQLRSDNDANRQIFGSLRALAAHVEQHRTT
jgi:acyl carrier protein